MKFTFLIFTILFAVGLAAGATLADWNFDDHAANIYDADTQTSQDLNIYTHGGFALATANIAGNPTHLRDGGYWNDTFGSVGWDSTSLAGAVASGNYLSLIFTTTEGTLMNLTNLKIAIDAQVNGGSYAIFTSADGFSIGNEVRNTTITTAGVTETLDLSGSSYQGLSSFEVRVFGYGYGISDRLTIGNIGTTDGVIDIELSGAIASEAQQGTLFIIK